MNYETIIKQHHKMKRYRRLMAGAKSKHAKDCYEGNFIGADFDIKQDLTYELSENWKEFNKKFIPIWLESHSAKSKVAAGLACGALWTISKGMQRNDVILCPDGQGSYFVGEIDSDYYFVPDGILPHRRKVKWNPISIERTSMSLELRKSTGVALTSSNITQYSDEIEALIEGNKPSAIIATDTTIEDPSVFALEKHLEEFLVQNWKHTKLGKKYKIFEDEGELVGQQYPSDTGAIDILAISNDGKTLLVVELKKGRVSDVVVGQIQRYMGYVKEELAENDQEVKGVIIGLKDDIRIKRALSVTSNIDFYQYQVSFKLYKGK